VIFRGEVIGELISKLLLIVARETQGDFRFAITDFGLGFTNYTLAEGFEERGVNIYIKALNLV
jgi:hypothetical protein